MTTRGIAFCANAHCDVGPRHDLAPAKTHFVLNPQNGFRCGTCGEMGKLELERSTWRMDEEQTHDWRFSEVRVNYHYDTYRREYRELAILKDTNAAGAVYELWSPMTRTKARAEKIAELTLANLWRNPHLAVSKSLVPLLETVLDLGKPRAQWTADLLEAADGWGHER